MPQPAQKPAQHGRKIPQEVDHRSDAEPQRFGMRTAVVGLLVIGIRPPLPGFGAPLPADKVGKAATADKVDEAEETAK